MKNTLEKKIIRRVYLFEKTRTKRFLIYIVLSILVSSFLALLLFMAILKILKQQQTLALFELFREDFGIIRMYFFDTIITIYEELPQSLVALFLIVLFLPIAIFYIFVRNYKKIKNKVTSFKNFFKKDE